jgi:hypothetical protein
MGVRGLHMDWLNLAVGTFRQYSATKANVFSSDQSIVRSDC